MHTFTDPQNQCRSHSSESLSRWAEAPILCKRKWSLNIPCLRKRCYVQISKLRGRGSWQSIVYSDGFECKPPSQCFGKIYPITPGTGRNPACCLSLPASTIKLSAEREEFLYVWGIKWEGSHSRLLKYMFNRGVISIKLDVQPLAVPMDGF